MELSIIGILLLGLISSTHAYLIDGGLHSAIVPGNADQPPNCGIRRCLSSEANCQGGNCTCLDGNEGDGCLSCFPPSMYKCCTQNDPNVHAFTNETFELNSPCRSLMAIYKYYHPSKAARNDAGGRTCHVTVHNYGERYAGKIYSGGFDVKITVRRAGQRRPNELHFRGFGGVEKRGRMWRYVFQLLIEVSGVWVDALTRPSVGVDYDVSINDHNNKRIIFTSGECQLTIIWRPQFPGQGANQTRIPGLCIGVDGSGPGELQWPNARDTICRSPRGPTMGNYARANNLNSKDEAALKVSLLKTDQWPNFIAAQCDPLAGDVEDCEALNLAGCQAGVKYCEFLLSFEHAVSCLSSGDSSPLGNQVAGYFRDCFNAVCSDSRSQCLATRNTILTAAPCNASTDFIDWPLTVAACTALPDP